MPRPRLLPRTLVGLAALLLAVAPVFAHGGKCRFGPGGPPAPAAEALPAWAGWYALNREGIERLRACDDVPRIFGQPLERGPGSQRVREVAERAALAHLAPLVAAPEGVPPSLLAAACIALARTSPGPDLVTDLIRLARRAPDPAVEEASLLALGHLRRGAPGEQLAPHDLDEVREVLFRALEDGARACAARRAAALALGLLGDQPTGGPKPEDPARPWAEARTTGRILRVLACPDTDADLAVALLLAVGLQPRRSAEDGRHLDALRSLAWDGRFSAREFPPIVRAHACLALGRLGSLGFPFDVAPPTVADDVALLQDLLAPDRREDACVRTAAAIGLGLLAWSGDAARRRTVAEALLRSLPAAEADEEAHGAGLLALVRVAGDAFPAEDLPPGTGVDDALFLPCTDVTRVPTPWQALAAGLRHAAVAELGAADAAGTAALLRRGHECVRLLVTRATDRGLPTDDRRAFLLALGLSASAPARTALTALLSDPSETLPVRAQAALGLGLIRWPLPALTRVLGATLEEVPGSVLMVHAARGLAVLGGPRIGGTPRDGTDLVLDLLPALRHAENRGRCLEALEALGSERAVAALVGILASAAEPSDLRALAARALGSLGDDDPLPAATRLRQGLFPCLAPGALAEVLSMP